MRFPKQFVNSGALANAHLTAGDLRLLIVLITMAGEDHIASAKQIDLAESAGISRKSIREAVNRLTKQHLLKHDSNRGRLTEYTVLPEYQMAPAPAIRVPFSPQANGTPEGAKSGTQMAPLKVPSPRGNQPSNLLPASEIEESFSRAWSSWPKKVERKQTLEAFRRAAKVRGLKTLEADVTRFGMAYARTASEVRFVPSLRAWLSDERWTDDLPAPSATVAPETRPRYQFNAPLTRTEQNMAVVAQIEAAEQATCTHRWMPDGTCNHCIEHRDHFRSSEVTA